MSEPTRIVGRTEVPASEAKCVSCSQPFKGGKKGDPGVNVYSPAGMREVAISGLCETCFDEITAEPVDDDFELPVKACDLGRPEGCESCQ